MDSTTERSPPAREKAAAIRRVTPTSPRLTAHASPAGAGSSVGWTVLVVVCYLLGAASLAGGLYVYLR